MQHVQTCIPVAGSTTRVVVLFPRFAKTFEEQWVETACTQKLILKGSDWSAPFRVIMEISTSKQEIRQAIDGRGYRNILLYGKTSIEPYYEIFVLQDPADVPSFDLVCDTLFYGNTWS